MSAEFRVNTYENNWQRASNVLALRNGGFVVTWESYFNQYDDGTETTYVAAQFYDANGKRVGSEKIARAVDGAYSGTPQATQLANGNIVLTWIESLDHPIISGDTRIKAQIFNAAGTAASAVIQVDTVTSSEAVAPHVLALHDGGFVVSFGASTSTGKLDEVYARAYSAGGAPRGLDKALNVHSNQFDELVAKSAALANGNSVVIWNSEAAISDGTDDGRNQLRATIFDGHGKAIRSDFELTPHFGGAGGFWSDDENYGYAVAAKDGGGFVVANLDWTPTDKDGAGTQGIYFSAYDAKGRAQGRPVPIFEQGTVVGDIEMARLATGQYVVAWNQQSLNDAEVSDDAYAVVLSSAGKPIGKVFEVGVDADKYDGQEDVSVAALAGGGFVVTYNSDSIDRDDEGIAGRVFGRGTAGADSLTVDASGLVSGLGGNDRLAGDARGNWLFGDGGNDTLTGGGGDDRLAGGAGADRLYGGSAAKGSGNDTFVFLKLSDSAAQASARDTVFDFARGDRFDLSTLDANTKAAGNQAFALIGTDQFHGRPGELRFDEAKSDTIIYADVNGDGKADFSIRLDDAVHLAKADFLL